MLQYLRAWWLILLRFRYYQPQQVTFRSLRKWLSQFPANQRGQVLALLCQIIFITEEEMRNMLLRLNEHLINKLTADGVNIDHIIYVQFDAAGSSSPVILNMLRDTANIARKGAKLADSNNLTEILNLTFELETGAIVYVDDFIGSGKQFIRNRKRVAEYIVGTFSEFILAPCICEEAIEALELEGVQPIMEMVHKRSQRPLHNECSYFDQDSKQGLVNLCHQIHPQQGLGFKKMATMVILYRNAPNSVPLLFRGSLKQHPYVGIFPRYDDLPF